MRFPLCLLFAACFSVPAAPPAPGPAAEPRLAALRRLTHGGENAEAYWSFDGRRLIYQATPEGGGCDQIYVMEADGSSPRMVSSGRGRATCSYFFPDGHILYSSTHHVSPDCPPPPDRSQGYVWPLYDYDIYAADADGRNVRPLVTGPAYDAEATVAPDGTRVVFTSTRDGDLELYSMAPDGSDVRRVTHEPGYDGGAFFSPDSRRLVYRASRPRDAAELADFQRLLAERLVRPTALEIYVAGADGSDPRALTHNGAANFAPSWLDAHTIIFASNVGDPKRRDFDLWIVKDDGTGLEQISFSPDFDGFPLLSPDGRWLAFASNRGGAKHGETNIFVAEWH